MCGVVGSLAFQETQPEALLEPVRRLMDRMVRRGPDDAGSWSDRHCALGFRRLSILDLTPTGHQPMLTVDGRHAIVFNGEIYNFRELRDELVAKGCTFRSTGDAETLLVALATWGKAALAKLNGMFAFGYYDLDRKRLLLARDHAGIKPLHYAITPRGAVFGSQYDQIISHPWTRDLAIDRTGLGMYLRFGFVPAPYGMHAHTRQVEAGQWVEIAVDGTVDSGQFFALPRWQQPTLRGDAALDAFEDTFSRAVRRHLISDVPVGVNLSGGIDSPLVAAEARRHHPGTLQAFTIEVDDPRHDESSDARRYAAELGVEQIVERVSADDALALVDEVAAACTEPTADYSMFPTLLVSRLARRHVKVVLSGDGGDELFWGYPSRFGSAIAQARYFGWPKLARLAAVAARKGFDRGAATREVLDYPSLGRLYQRKHTLTNEHDLAAIVPDLPALPADFSAFEFADSDTDRAAQFVRWNEFQIHLARVLQKVDRASMHHSLEVRVPLLDREVIELAWRVDWATCIDVERRVGKQVLRRALAKRLRHQTSAKRGFSVPMDRWLVGPLQPLLRDLVIERDELLGIPLRREALRATEQRLIAGDTNKAWGLWLLLSLALWSHTHHQKRHA